MHPSVTIFFFSFQVLQLAQKAGDHVIPLYCFDPNHFKVPTYSTAIIGLLPIVLLYNNVGTMVSFVLQYNKFGRFLLYCYIRSLIPFVLLYDKVFTFCTAI